MTTSRRRSFATAPTSTDWPGELADPEAKAWASGALTEAWLQAHGVEHAPSQTSNHPTNAGRRSAAIKAWAHAHHPSERWPNFVDNHWMNTTGLSRIEQQADRAVFRETMKWEAP